MLATCDHLDLAGLFCRAAVSAFCGAVHCGVAGALDLAVGPIGRQAEVAMQVWDNMHRPSMALTLTSGVARCWCAFHTGSREEGASGVNTKSRYFGCDLCRSGCQEDHGQRRTWTCRNYCSDRAGPAVPISRESCQRLPPSGGCLRSCRWP